MWPFEPLSTLLLAGVFVSSTKVAELLVSHFYCPITCRLHGSFSKPIQIKGVRRNGRSIKRRFKFMRRKTKRVSSDVLQQRVR
ncbi:hypothetical protein Hanom_Chr17g01532731 [Helianthus anomalus]